MAQTFTVNGREMTLKQAQDWYASRKVTGAPSDDATEEVDTMQGLEVKSPEKSTDELKKECDALGIKYHPATGAKKLTALLQNHKKGV